MSRIKADAKAIKRGSLNTTINEEVLTAFKMKSRALGIDMNVILECMMKAFLSDEITLKVGKNNKIEVDMDE